MIPLICLYFFFIVCTKQCRVTYPATKPPFFCCQTHSRTVKHGTVKHYSLSLSVARTNTKNAYGQYHSCTRHRSHWRRLAFTNRPLSTVCHRGSRNWRAAPMKRRVGPTKPAKNTRTPRLSSCRLVAFPLLEPKRTSLNFLFSLTVYTFTRYM